MTGQKENSLCNEQKPVPVYLTLPEGCREDEVRLVELWRIVFSGKWIVLFCVVASLLLGAGYITMAKPEYRIEIQVLPPTIQDLGGFILVDVNRARSLGVPLANYTTKKVFAAFVENLKLAGVRRQFFDESSMVSIYRELYGSSDGDDSQALFRRFNNSLSVDGRNSGSSYKIRFKSYDPEFAASTLNNYVRFVDAYTMRQLVDEVNAVISVRIDQLRMDIRNKINAEKKWRQDRLLILNEALQKARIYGVQEAQIPAFLDAGANNAQMQGALEPEQMYRLGTQILEQEIQLLETRISDEPFVIGLRKLQDGVAFLQNILISPDGMSATTVDMWAVAPQQAETPKKMLVMVIALMIGLLVGIFSALFYSALSGNR